MKKNILILLALLSANCVFAQEYTHSLGIVMGSVNGLSYKCIATDNFAVQVDLAAGLSLSPMTYEAICQGKNASNGLYGSYSVWNFAIKPNFMYQGEVGNNFSIFAGGGTSIGMGDMFGVQEGGIRVLDFKTNLKGQFGVNAIVGAEYKLTNHPVTISLDFRPGYAMLFDSEKVMNIRLDNLYHYFDWNLGLAIRYCF